MSTSLGTGALALLALLVALPPVLRLPGRRATPWARRELARRAEEAERRFLATQEPPPMVRRDEVMVVRMEPHEALAVAGTVRLVFHAEHWTTARDRPADPIDSVAEADGRWLFATRAGQLFRADTFDGPLALVGTVRCASHVVQLSDGRAVIEDTDGALWTSDGTAPPTRLTGVPGAMVASFVDPRQGAVIAAGGALWVTHDGGRSWQPHPLGEEAAVALHRTERGLVAETTAGEVLLFRAPAASPHTPTPEQQTDLSFARARLPHQHLRVHLLAPTCNARSDQATPWALPVAPNAWPIGRGPDPEEDDPLVWAPPAFTVVIPRAHDDRLHDGGGWPAEIADRAAPLGPPDALRHVASRFVASRAAALRVPSPVGEPLSSVGEQLSLAWRGEDNRGAFTGHARVWEDAVVEAMTSGREIGGPIEPDVELPSELVVATRTGAILADYVSDGSGGLVAGAPVWIGAAGARAVPRPWLPMPRAAGLAHDDGGATLLFITQPRTSSVLMNRAPAQSLEVERWQPTPRALVLTDLAPDGSVRAHRAWAFRTDDRGYVAVAEGPFGWGLARASAGTPGELRVYPLDGREPLTLPAPPSDPRTTEGYNPLCRSPAAAPGSTHLHAVYMVSAVFRPGFDSPTYALPTRVDYDLEDGRWCVRRVEGTTRYLEGPCDWEVCERYAQEAHYHFRLTQPWRVVRLVAQGGTLVGTMDDGSRIAQVRARVAHFTAGSAE